MNHFSVFSVYLIIFYSSFSFCQEFDKELSADYLRKSDSLLKIGWYEAAESYLSFSLSYQPRELRTKEYLEKYNKQKSYLDSLISCCLTDSMRCRHRVETALFYIEKDYRSTAYDWFSQAEEYCDNSEYFRCNYKKLFSPKVPDTIWVNSNDLEYNGFEIIRSDPEQNKFIEDHFNYDMLSDQIIHLRRDTSLFSGVVIKKVESHRIHRFSSGGTFNIWHVKNGKVMYHVQHTVLNDPEKNSIPTSDPEGKKIMNYFDDDNYYYSVKKNNGDTFVKFYPNGDTLSKSFKIPGHSYNRFSISYYPNGDTNSYNLQSKTDTNALTTEFRSWNEDNNLIYKSSEVLRMDKSQIYYESIKFDKYGDTIEYWYNLENEKLHGVQIIPLYSLEYEELEHEDTEDNHYLLKAEFVNGRLKTFLNRDIIFLDKRFRQISESEFLELIEPQMHGTFWFNEYMFSLRESYEINGISYNAVACPEIYRLSRKINKLKRKLKRME